jgi:hypothetical protein
VLLFFDVTGGIRAGGNYKRNMDMDRNRRCSAGLKPLVLVGIILGLWGCHLPKPRYDSAFNPQREKIGLEPLPPGCLAISVDKDFTVWRVPDIKKGGPHLSTITPTYNKDSLLYEVDKYYSGRTFNTNDGNDFEWLEVGYNFVATVMGLDTVTGWHCEFNGLFRAEDKKDTTVPASTSYTTTAISLAQADSILKKWGLKPPARP